MKLNKDKVNILGVHFYSVTMTEATAFIVETMQGQGKASVFTPNPEIVMDAYKDEKLKGILNESEMTIPDGIGVVIGSKIIGQPLPERVAGYDLLQNVFAQVASTPLKVYFFGAAKGVADLAAEKMRQKYPGLNIVGVHHGYIDSDDRIIEEINAVKPDLLLVGLGAPRQEYWIYRNRDKIDAKVFFGCGGSFDGMSGVLKRAPKVFIKLNLEWFHRLLKQPTRAKRMLRLPQFLIKMIIEGRRYQ